MSGTPPTNDGPGAGIPDSPSGEETHFQPCWKQVKQG